MRSGQLKFLYISGLLSKTPEVASVSDCSIIIRVVFVYLSPFLWIGVIRAKFQGYTPWFKQSKTLPMLWRIIRELLFINSCIIKFSASALSFLSFALLLSSSRRVMSLSYINIMDLT